MGPYEGGMVEVDGKMTEPKNYLCTMFMSCHNVFTSSLVPCPPPSFHHSSCKIVHDVLVGVCLSVPRSFLSLAVQKATGKWARGLGTRLTRFTMTSVTFLACI